LVVCVVSSALASSGVCVHPTPRDMRVAG
jgi:hypothetical protein